MSLIHILQNEPVLLLGIVTILGLIAGSFLNVVIHRLPKMMEMEWHAQCRELLEQQPAEKETTPYNLVVPRSSCPQCGHNITAMENIPVVSYLLQKGKCSSCGHSISSHYPLVELLGGGLAALAAWHFGFGWQLAGALVLVWALISLCFIDLDHQLLPDSITLPLLWLGLIFNLFGTFVPLHEAVIGAISGYLVLWLVYIVFKLVTGKEGMGHGDFKLLAMLGAWLGYHQLPTIIILSSLVGAIFGICQIIFQKRDRSKPIPFGPFLACAGWIAFMWGTQISELYLQWALGG